MWVIPKKKLSIIIATNCSQLNLLNISVRWDIKLLGNILYYNNIIFIFKFQDEFGNSQYGYSNLNSAKHEVGNAFTGVSGSYQYVDAAGKLQTVNYVADHLGFRVQDSRIPVHVAALPEPPVHDAELPVAPVHEYELPVAPVYNGVAPVAPVYDGVAPEPVEDTPEVAAAKAEFLAAFEEVKNREKRESDPMAFNAYGYNR